MSKKFIFQLLIIISLLFLTSCRVNQNFIVSYDGVGSFGNKTNEDGLTMHTLEMVSSLQKLKNLCIVWNNDAFLEVNENNSNELNFKLREYDQKFFGEKNLIIYSFERGHSKEIIIKQIYNKNNVLIIETKTKNKRGNFTDESFNWIMLIEINKVEVTSIKIEHK